MSFGWSATDIVNLVTLAWTTVQNCKKACGEYVELTQQVQGLHGVIKRLRLERSNPRSLLNRPEESCWEELRPSLEGSQDVLQALNDIVVKYALVNRKDKSPGRLWTRVKFGNKELGTINDLQQKARFYTGAISTLLDTVTVGALGRIEDSLNEAGLRGIMPAIEDIARKLVTSNNKDGSVLTAYPNDDTAVWKELRRELIKENLVPSNIISKNKDLITKFIRELGERGVLDELKEEDEGNQIDVETQEIDDDSSDEPWCKTESSSKESAQLKISDKNLFSVDSFTISRPYHSNQEPLYMDEPWMPKSTTLTHEALLRFDLQHRIPEFVASMLTSNSLFSDRLASRNIETPSCNRDWKKVKTKVVFLATPWGLCLLASHINLSLCLEYLKFLVSLLDPGFPNVGDIDPTGAFNNGQSRYERKEMAKTLQGSQRKIFSSIGNFISLCEDKGQRPPRLSDSDHQSEILAFCDSFLQHIYDQWNSFKGRDTSEDLPKLWEFCISKFDFMVKSWMRDFFLTCGDIIRFIEVRRDGSSLSLIVDDRAFSWIDQQALSAEDSSPAMEYSIGEFPDQKPHGETDDGPKKKLEAIIERLEYLLARSEDFLYSSRLDSPNWQKQYLELHERIMNEVLLELDKLSIHGDAKLGKRKKRAIDEAQKALDQLEEADNIPR